MIKFTLIMISEVKLVALMAVMSQNPVVKAFIIEKLKPHRIRRGTDAHMLNAVAGKVTAVIMRVKIGN